MAMTLENYLNGGYAAGNAMSQRRRQDAETWKTMLTQINNTKPDTMLGYGLGKLLRGAWDHKQRRAFEEKSKQRNAQGYQGGTTPEALTIAGLSPNAEVDTSRTIYGIAPTQGLMGDALTPVAMTAGQTKQTVEDSAGNKQTTTVNTPVTIQGSPTLADAVQQVMQNNPAALGQQNYSLADLFKKNSYSGY